MEPDNDSDVRYTSPDRLNRE